MIEEKIFVPRILLCCDREEFFARVDRRPFELVGQVEFFGESGHELDLIRSGKFLLNDKPVALSELSKMIRGGCSILLSSTTTEYLTFFIIFLYIVWAVRARK